MSQAKEPLEIGATFRRAATCYRAHFFLLFGIALIVNLPSLLSPFLGFFFPWVGGENKELPNQILKTLLENIESLSLWTIVGLLGFILSFIFSAVSYGALTYAANKSTLGERIRIKEAFLVALSRVVPLCLNYLFYTVCVGFSLLFCILPGICLAAILAMLPLVALLERWPFIEGVRRALALSAGFRLELILFFVVFIMLSMGAGLTTFLVKMLFTYVNDTLSIVMANLLGQGLKALIYPYAFLILIQVYHESLARQGDGGQEI